MLLRFERTLACGPEAAWFLLNDPRGMALWSTAHVQSLSLGDGAHPAGVGAVRRVHAASGMAGTRWDEVVVAAEPPERFVYRATGGSPGTRGHRGTLTCEPLRRGTRVLWELDVKPSNRWVGAALRRALVPRFEANLDRLERAARHAPTPSLPPRRDLDETASLPNLWEAARACRREQRELAEALASTDAPERWFTRVFERVTGLELQACEEGGLEHPGWALRLIVASHRYYVENLRGWLRREPAAVEAHWSSAFRDMELLDGRDPGRLARIRETVGRGLRASLEEDRPRALAQVWADAYAGRCDYVRFRADDLALASLLESAGAPWLAAIPKDEWPSRLRWLGRVCPQAAAGRLSWGAHQDPAQQSRLAFERGERIASLLARGSQPGDAA